LNIEQQTFDTMNGSPFQRVEVHRLDGNQVADNWSVYGPWIMDVMKHDLQPIDAVECMQRLRGDNYVCLQATIDGSPVGIAICAQTFLDSGHALEVVALAGDNFDQWIDRMFYALKMVAISQRNKRIFLVGRMGWKKRLNALGWKARAITMEYEI